MTKQKIRAVNIKPSPVCNLRCSYCYTEYYPDAEGNLLSYGVMEKGKVSEFPLGVLDSIMLEYEATEINFSGMGETTLCPNLQEMILHCFEKYSPQLIMLFSNAVGRPVKWYKNLIDVMVEKGHSFTLSLSLHVESNNIVAIKEIMEYYDSIQDKRNSKCILQILTTKENVDTLIRFCKENVDLALKSQFLGSNFQKDTEEETFDKLLKGTGLPLNIMRTRISDDNRYKGDCYLNSLDVLVRKGAITVTQTDSEYNTVFKNYYPLPHEEPAKKKSSSLHKPRIKIALPYPNHGKIHPRTVQSVDRLMGVDCLDIDISKIQGSSISNARNSGIPSTHTNAVYQNYFDFDYYLSLDADIAFEPEHLLQLLGRDKDIIGGAYPMRDKPELYVAGIYSKGTNYFEVDSFLPSSTQGLVEVDWIGAGFTLVKADVFKRTRYPWYREEIVEYKIGDKEYARWVGEDVGFCMNAQRAGFKIYVDCDCILEHLCNSEETLDEMAEASIEALRTLENRMKKMYQGCKMLEQLSTK